MPKYNQDWFQESGKDGGNSGGNGGSTSPSNTISKALEPILNYGNAAEGTTLPPPQSGNFRVPPPSNFQVISSEFNFAGNIFVLSWLDIVDRRTPVARYNIYGKNFLDVNAEPTLLGSSSKSPFHARVIASEESTIIFYLQPVLQNGITLPLVACPTCTGLVPDAIYILEVDDDTQGLTAKIEISGDAPLGGGTTAGLWIEFPDAVTPPLDTAYTTVSGGGLECYFNDSMVLSGSALYLREQPSSTEFLALFTTYTGLLSAAKAGLISALDGTGTGALGIGARAILGGDGILALDSTTGGGDQIIFTSQIESTAGAITHYLVVQVDIGSGLEEKRMALYAPS